MGCDLHDGGIGGMGVTLLLIKLVLRLIDRLTNDICSIRYSGSSADGCYVIKYRVLWELTAFVLHFFFGSPLGSAAKQEMRLFLARLDFSLLLVLTN